MCGIAGIFAYHYAANPVAATELRRIRDHMAARGPDGAGEWLASDGHLALGHRRLAIIDLSDGAAQPMASADGEVVITFNGEIYNYRELRADLAARGYRCRGASDTEVLLQLYAAKGPAMVHDLRGMFAFALWDGRKQGLLLARDPYGIKPLYYADDGWTLRFASQVKALLAGGALSREAEPAGWAGFLLFGSVPEPYTAYRDIRALPAGTTMWIDRLGSAGPARYCAIGEAFRAAEQESPAPVTEHLPRVRSALLDSLRHHLVADVPVGIFLSGGIDSGALLALAYELGHRLDAITLSYPEFAGSREDEAPLAGRLAARCGSRHRVRIVSEAEFTADLPHILAAMDQPSIDGINTWFAAKAARELGLKAVISGIGGDELFGGYPSFRDIPRLVRATALPARIPFLGDVFRHVLAALCRSGAALHPKLAGIVKYGGSYGGAYLLRRAIFLPWELGAVLDRGFIDEGLRRLDLLPLISAAAGKLPRHPIGRVAALETGFYLRNQLLRDADWAAMAHSVELRVPFVDVRLLREVAPILLRCPVGAGKRLLAASPEPRLPRDIVERPKTGFATPIAEWLQRDRQLRAWRSRRELASPACPWSRRWAYQLAAA